jgi:PleD family two-component response regulator
MIALSEAAGRIEDLMLALRDADDDSYEVIWSQISRSMDEIKNASALAAGSHATVPDVPYLAHKLILVGDAQKFAAESAELAQKGIADTIILDSVEMAQRRLRAGSVDGVIIDFGYGHSDEILSFIFNTRLQSFDAPPVALLGAHARALQRHERLYLGSSLTMEGGADPLLSYARCLIGLTDAGKPRILTIDDGRALMSSVGPVLGSVGMNVRALSNPACLFEKIEEFKPDVIIVDADVPSVSGHDIIRILRASEEYRNTPVLLADALGDRAAWSAALRVGATGTLIKPILPEQLISAVREQVQLKRLTQVAADIGDDGLYTRRAVLSRLEAMSKNKGIVSAAMIAVKKFDVIGSRHGLRAQDAVSDLACALLRSRFRYQDVRARWSESTYAVLFPGETIDVVGAAVSLLCDEFALCELKVPNGSVFKPSLSFGLSSQECDKLDGDKLLDSAYRHLNAATFA